MSDNAPVSNKCPRPWLRIAALAALAAAGLAAAALGAYLARSPLRAGESLVNLIDFEPLFIVRVTHVKEAWERFQQTRDYRAVADTPEGRAALASSLVARAARHIDQAGRMLGRQWVDIFDIFGDETLVIGVPTRSGSIAFLCLSRLKPTANIALGVKALLHTSEDLPLPDNGRSWVIAERSVGIGWTKLGDVIALSNDAGLLARAVAAARHRGRKTARLAAAIDLECTVPQAAVRLPIPNGPDSPGAADLPRELLLKIYLPYEQVHVHTGMAPGRMPAFEGFRRATFGSLGHLVHYDPCVIAFGHSEPRVVWQSILRTLAPAEREDVLRYVEDNLSALLDVEDFEKEVVAGIDGNWGLVVSHEPDPWLTLASGQPALTTGCFVSVREDARFTDRLPLLLPELATAIMESDRRLKVETGVEEYQGAKIHFIRVHRPGVAAQPAAAGFAVIGSEGRPQAIVAASSIDWLHRALATVTEAPYWPFFRGEWSDFTGRPPSGPTYFASLVNSGALADALARLAASQHPAQPASALPDRLVLSALGPLVVTGSFPLPPLAPDRATDLPCIPPAR